MEITLNWIFGILVTCAGGFITWSLKNLYGQLQEDKVETRQLIAEHAKKTEADSSKLQSKIERLEDKLPEKYVLKEDFYREINKLDLKLDSVKEDIGELNKTVSSLVALQSEILKNMKKEA